MHSSSRSLFTYAAACGLCSALAFYAGRTTAASPTAAASVTVAGKNKSAAMSAFAAPFASDPARKNALLNALLNSPGQPDAEDLALWAASLSAQDCAVALSSLQALPTGLAREALLKAVIGAWAKHDPASFLAVTGQVANPRLRESGVTEALHNLALKDPPSALEWLKQNPSTGAINTMEARFNAAVAGFAANDPMGAFSLVNNMPDASKQETKLKRDAYSAIADGLSLQGRFGDAMALFMQLPAGNTRDDAVTSVLDRWGAAAPPDAATWIANNASPAVRNDYNSSLVDAWVKSDPAAAATYAVQAEQQLLAAGDLNNPNNNADTVPNAISAWAKYDLNAAGEFINQLPASPVKDRALSSFISTASKVDPESALAWAATASTPQEQQKLILQVAKQWQQTDAAAFTQFLATTPLLTPEQKLTLTAPTKNNNGGKGQGNNQNGG